MKTRRLGLSGVCVAIAALVLSACGASPYLPPAVTLTSPYMSASTPFVDGISGIGKQQARIVVCSIGGGPLEVHVHHPNASEGTSLTVRATSTDTTGDEADTTLIDVGHPSPTVGVDTYFESTRDLRPGECAEVILLSTYNMLAPGPSFHFTVTW